jgi:hypothetical protein
MKIFSILILSLLLPMTAFTVEECTVPTDDLKMLENFALDMAETTANMSETKKVLNGNRKCFCDSR